MSIEGSRRNYSWAVFLIIIGIVLLLNTTNIVGWGIWIYASRYWPVLVVLLGLRIILGGSLVARILQMIFTIVLTLAVLIVAYIQFTAEPLELLPESINSWILQGGGGILNLSVDNTQGEYMISSEGYDEIEKVSLDMDVGAGKFTLKEDDMDDLVHVETKYPKTSDEPTLTATQDGDEINIEFKSASSKGFYLFSNESSYDISLNRIEKPFNLDVNLGAGDGKVVLENTIIENFYGEVGAGKMNIQLGIESVPTGEVRFTVGAGKMELVLPQRVGYQVEYDLGVGSIQIDGEDLSGVSGGRGKYTSDNFASTDIQLTMYITVGVGKFEITSE